MNINPNEILAGMLERDDSFKFRCTKCGRCCKNREDILLTPFDMYRISAYLQQSPSSVLHDYCICYIGNTSKLPAVILRSVGTERACPFLKNDSCSIHSAKPSVCALFPLGRAAAADVSGKDTRVFYFLQPVNCGARDETHTVREWLAGFDLDDSDEWFYAWQDAIRDLFPLVQKLLEVLPSKPMQMMYDALAGFLYLNYDLSKPFLPQFRENIEKFKALANRFLSIAEAQKGGKNT